MNLAPGDECRGPFPLDAPWRCVLPGGRSAAMASASSSCDKRRSTKGHMLYTHTAGQVAPYTCPSHTLLHPWRRVNHVGLTIPPCLRIVNRQSRHDYVVGREGTAASCARDAGRNLIRKLRTPQLSWELAWPGDGGQHPCPLTFEPTARRRDRRSKDVAVTAALRGLCVGFRRRRCGAKAENGVLLIGCSESPSCSPDDPSPPVP